MACEESSSVGYMYIVEKIDIDLGGRIRSAGQKKKPLLGREWIEYTLCRIGKSNRWCWYFKVGVHKTSGTQRSTDRQMALLKEWKVKPATLMPLKEVLYQYKGFIHLDLNLSEQEIHLDLNFEKDCTDFLEGKPRLKHLSKYSRRLMRWPEHYWHNKSRHHSGHDFFIF